MKFSGPPNVKLAIPPSVIAPSRMRHRELFFGAECSEAASSKSALRWIFSLQHGAKAAVRSARVRHDTTLHRPVRGCAGDGLRRDRFRDEDGGTRMVSATERLPGPRCPVGMSRRDSGGAQRKAKRQCCNACRFIRDALPFGRRVRAISVPRGSLRASGYRTRRYR
jgi:hypothetical protein